MVSVIKEICISGKWNTIGILYIRDERFDSMHLKYGDTIYRRYADVTRMVIDFHQPEGTVRTIQKSSLALLRSEYGIVDFDRSIGYFPFDTADWTDDDEISSSLSNNYGITNCRIICFRC